MTRLAAILLAGLMAGCAAAVPPPADPVAERWLTPEEDAFIKERCLPYAAVGGCVVVPLPLYRRLLEALHPGIEV